MVRRFPATCADYQTLARRRLPRFLADYLEGGAGTEQTLAANAAAWATLPIRQRVLVDVAGIDTSASLLGEQCSLPLVLAPVGLAGMMARRGEAQAARAARSAGVPFTLSTVGICGLEEVAGTGAPPWFQLYMLRDRGVVEALLASAWAAGVRTLVFTVDLPLAGPRHRDVRNGLGQAGLRPKLLKISQLLSSPGWLYDVGVRGKPHGFGCLDAHVPVADDINAFRRWIDAQFDPSITWDDVAWLRERWQGRLVVKGLLDPADAEAAVAAGADAIVVSNHGGRQLDGAAATAASLPAMVSAVAGRAGVLVDGGLRSGVDVFRALALGANGVLIGRPWAWALAANGERGVASLLELWRRELEVTMALAGVTRIADIGPHNLDRA